MKELEGDLLNAKSNLILHQVNTQGVMGGGIAKQIAKKYPGIEKKYQEYIKKHSGKPEDLLGKVHFVNVGNYVIGNCFSQNPDFSTNYDALKKCMARVNNFMDKKGYNSVSIPDHYGSGIANGDWDTIKGIFSDNLGHRDLTSYKFNPPQPTFDKKILKKLGLGEEIEKNIQKVKK